MKNIFSLTVLLLFCSGGILLAQDLDQLLNEISEDKTPTFALGTFKGTTVINGQSIEVPGQSDLNFIVNHRFGALKQGIYDFFGIDQATTRIGFEYGIRNIASLSIGRNGLDKTYDGGIKLRILRQQTGIKNIPVSVSVYSAAYVKTLTWEHPESDNFFSSRLSYASQILIARKFNPRLSIQLSPTYIHKNLVPLPKDQNNIFALGLGGRIKVSRKISLNAEYFYLLPGETAKNFVNSLSFGVDIETGGHVFQLQFTNSQAMFAKGFVAETPGEWREGDIYIGFNLYRVFPKHQKSKNIH
jgi:hypothetical protein